MLFSVLLFAVGLVLLIKGGDWFVDGATGIAKRFNLPDIVVGATVVSVLELLLLLPHPVKQSVAVTAQTQSANAPMTVAVVFLFVVFFILITSLLEFVLFIYVFLFYGYILSFFLMEYNIRFPRDSSIKRHFEGEVSFLGQVDIDLPIYVICYVLFISRA